MAAALGCYRRIAVNIGLYIVTSWDLKFHFRLRRLWGVFSVLSLIWPKPGGSHVKWVVSVVRLECGSKDGRMRGKWV